MFATVATHAARNSRGIGGSPTCGFCAIKPWIMPIEAATKRRAAAARIAERTRAGKTRSAAGPTGRRRKRRAGRRASMADIAFRDWLTGQYLNEEVQQRFVPGN